MVFCLRALISMIFLTSVVFAQPKIPPVRKELIYPQAADYHRTSPFRSCDKRLASFDAPSGTPRLDHLNALKREFKKQFLLDDAGINAAFEPVLLTPPDSPEHQAKLESLTVLLNRLEFKKAKLAEPATALMAKLLRFNAPGKREPTSIGKMDECLRKPSREFLDYATVVRDSIINFYSPYEFATNLINILEKTPLFPSGTRVFFGATTNRENGVKTICVNPEEETTLLISKVMHELVHVSNDEVAALTATYEKSRDKWQASKVIFTSAESDLIKFDDEIGKDSELDSENLRDILGESNVQDPEAIRNIIISTTGKRKPYLRLALEAGLQLQTKLLYAWKIALRQTELDKTEALKDRTNLDIERFYDEHSAYSVSLKSAWALVNEQPEFFCRIWVPSFQEQRPVRFFQAFEKLEAQIYEKTFSSWLANEYSIVAGNYLKTSLYPEGDKANGIKFDLAKKAQEILAKEFRIQ